MTVRRTLYAAVALLAATLQCGIARAERIAFIGCPVLRDMNLPQLPCWLAEDGDKLYFLGIQSDTIPPIVFSPPQLLHRVLVEGDLSSNEMVCGAPPIKNVKVSVLPEIDPACNKILPQANYVAPAPPKIPLPLRQGTRLATVPLPGTTNQFIAPRPPAPQAPFAAKSFRIEYGFGEDFLYLDDSRSLTEAAWYVQDTSARQIVIEAHRDRVALTNGQIMEEDEAVARRRAERVRAILIEWGIEADRISVRAVTPATPASRYLILTVQP